MMSTEVITEVQEFKQGLEIKKLDAQQEADEHAAALTRDEHLEARDFMNRMMGHVEMTRAFADFANVQSLVKLAEIKKDKLYKSLKGVKAYDRDGKIIANVGTWDGFCRAIGMSSSKVDQDIQNLNTFGEEALDRLNQLGIGYRNMRRLRQIPEEDRIAIIEGEQIEVGDKEQIVDLIEQMSAKHAREKKELSDKVENLESERQVDQRLLADKETKLNELERELRRDLTPDQAAKKRAERDELLKSELTDKSLSSISILNELALVVEKILDLEDRTDHLEESLYAELRGVFRHALLLGRQYDILPEQLLGIPVPDLADFDRVIEGDAV
jgi:hypothetical protein